MEENFLSVSDLVYNIFDIMNTLNDNEFYNGVFHKNVELGNITLYLRIDSYGANIANYDMDREKQGRYNISTSIFRKDGNEEGVEIVTDLVNAINEVKK
jgi:uncharacterized protein YxeA